MHQLQSCIFISYCEKSVNIFVFLVSVFIGLAYQVTFKNHLQINILPNSFFLSHFSATKLIKKDIWFVITRIAWLNYTADFIRVFIDLRKVVEIEVGDDAIFFFGFQVFAQFFFDFSNQKIVVFVNAFDFDFIFNIFGFMIFWNEIGDKFYLTLLRNT